ncbi:hypothetical protein QBC41DRAFT_29296 [Cercophora samala]|uniref:Kelch repeat protein n=1 Tax=Cercophora samala TaxID=330535 RepID=A0AA40DD25_9PEZI|nr:hypothetical protein QBC41DRAFT_29296 [Cercophora samala]
MLTPDGKGGATWSDFQTSNSAKALDRLSLTGVVGATAVTHDAGFVIGGVVGYSQPIHSILKFNMSDRSIQVSDKAVDFSPSQTLVGGSAEYIPSFGRHGLIMLLGGCWPNVLPQTVSYSETPCADFKNITFFDPITNEVYWQLATGSIPDAPRQDFCTAGFATTDGGYDIFLYGGRGRDYGGSLPSWGYVLSLPAFRWIRMISTATGFEETGEERAHHACVAVGNRQVLVIGGEGKIRDLNKLLIWDMSKLNWKYSYDAEALPYDRPTIIDEWYRTG